MTQHYHSWAHTQKHEKQSRKEIRTALFTAASFTGTNGGWGREAARVHPQMMDTHSAAHPHMSVLTPATARMSLEDMVPSEVSQTPEDRY